MIHGLCEFVGRIYWSVLFVGICGSLLAFLCVGICHWVCGFKVLGHIGSLDLVCMRLALFDSCGYVEMSAILSLLVVWIRALTSLPSHSYLLVWSAARVVVNGLFACVQ